MKRPANRNEIEPQADYMAEHNLEVFRHPQGDRRNTSDRDYDEETSNAQIELKRGYGQDGRGSMAR